jgi:hypothetical protein
VLKHTHIRWTYNRNLLVWQKWHSISSWSFIPANISLLQFCSLFLTVVKALLHHMTFCCLWQNWRPRFCYCHCYFPLSIFSRGRENALLTPCGKAACRENFWYILFCYWQYYLMSEFAHSFVSGQVFSTNKLFINQVEFKWCITLLYITFSDIKKRHLFGLSYCICCRFVSGWQ